MKLWLVTADRWDYDDYDSFVCAAPDEATARRVDPRGVQSNQPEWLADGESFLWRKLDAVITVTCLGDAAQGIVSGTVFCASYNAG